MQKPHKKRNKNPEAPSLSRPASQPQWFAIVAKAISTPRRTAEAKSSSASSSSSLGSDL